MQQDHLAQQRSWTAVSYRLERHFGLGITEVDDFQVLLETLTTPSSSRRCTSGARLPTLAS